MEIKNINFALENASMDKAAGIKVVKMTGNTDISVFAAEIAPNTTLNPHYHTKGIETYQILEGKGLMKIGDLSSGTTVNWVESFEAIAGDCFSIPENTVHQLINNTNSRLRAIFSCPSDHLGNDRFFIK